MNLAENSSEIVHGKVAGVVGPEGVFGKVRVVVSICVIRAAPGARACF